MTHVNQSSMAGLSFFSPKKKNLLIYTNTSLLILLRKTGRDSVTHSFNNLLHHFRVTTWMNWSQIHIEMRVGVNRHCLFHIILGHIFKYTAGGQWTTLLNRITCVNLNALTTTIMHTYLVITKEPHSRCLVVLVISNKDVIGPHLQDLITIHNMHEYPMSSFPLFPWFFLLCAIIFCTRRSRSSCSLNKSEY